MINNLIGKTKEEALEYINNFYKMTEGLEYNEELLNEAIVYNDIYKQGNRKTCATLPFRGIKKAIKEYKGTVILVSHEEAFYKDLKARIITT